MWEYEKGNVLLLFNLCHNAIETGLTPNMPSAFSGNSMGIDVEKCMRKLTLFVETVQKVSEFGVLLTMSLTMNAMSTGVTFQ